MSDDNEKAPKDAPDTDSVRPILAAAPIAKEGEGLKETLRRIARVPAPKPKSDEDTE